MRVWIHNSPIINTGTAINLTPAARSHPLFPMLDYIARGIHQQGQRFAEVEGRLVRMEHELQSVKRLQAEMEDLLQQCNKKNFSLKQEGFEVGLSVCFVNVLHYTCENEFHVPLLISKS